MTRWQLISLTALTMIAFAANSVLCRLALAGGSVDAISFNAIRIGSGAILLVALMRFKKLEVRADTWLPSVMLFAYAACFSLAYLQLSAGTGALLLFGAVQVTMFVGGLISGERPSTHQWLGWMCAASGLVYLVLPGLQAPPLIAAGLMAAAGIAWGVYSLIGRKNSDPIAATARNFALAAPMAVGLLIGGIGSLEVTSVGVFYAVASGAVTSALGYVLWYKVLRHLAATTAAIAQLTVPLLAALAGAAFLSEALTMRLLVASILTLGGVAAAIMRPRAAA